MANQPLGHLPMNERREALLPDRTVTDSMGLRDPGLKGVLTPATAGEAMELAKVMSSGKFAVPNYLRNNPGDCLRVVLVAARTGLDPFMLANETYLTESKKSGEQSMAFMSKAVYAIVLASGVLRGDLVTEIDGEGANVSCIVTGERRDGQVHTEIYSLASIHPKNSPLWQTQPRQQLIYYGQRAWCRLHAPDALMGLVTPEDPPLDVTPETPPPPRPTRTPKPKMFQADDGVIEDSEPPEPEPEQPAQEPEGELWTLVNGHSGVVMGEWPGAEGFVAGFLMAWDKHIPDERAQFLMANLEMVNAAIPIADNKTAAAELEMIRNTLNLTAG